jgi:methyl-accepting chemotaxis protein
MSRLSAYVPNAAESRDEETSASAQEIASSAQVLASDAAELEQLVGQFTLTAV